MTHIPAEVRQAVIARAERRCEYCRFPEAFAFLSFEIEHVIAEKHGGATTSDDLAWACPYCNRHKGTDLGSLDPETGQVQPGDKRRHPAKERPGVRKRNLKKDLETSMSNTRKQCLL